MQYFSVLQRPFKLDADLFIQYFKLDDICILPYGKIGFIITWYLDSFFLIAICACNYCGTV
jgi:hypothetical protein